MNQLKDRIVQIIEQDAWARVAHLAGRFPHAQPQEREAIQAGIDFERWLAESCRECLQ